MVTESLFLFSVFFFFFFFLYRESFPNDLQFTILMRFTVDQTQTPNLKVSSVIVRVCVRVHECVHVCPIYELNSEI